MSQKQNCFYLTFLLALVSASGFWGCRATRDVVFYKKAQDSQNKQEYVQAILFLNKAINLSDDPKLLLRSAKKGLYILKKFIKNELQETSKNLFQIRYLRLILLHSHQSRQRFLAQRRLADIYFNNMRDYRRAIEALTHLLAFNLTQPQRQETQLKIAKSYYYIGKLDQAKVELEQIRQEGRFIYDVLLLRGHIFLGEKQLERAILTYKDLMRRFPKRSMQDQVFLTLSTCYEEKGAFKSAIQLLEGFLKENNGLGEDQKTFIAMKIQRLQETHKMQPGVFQEGERYRR